MTRDFDDIPGFEDPGGRLHEPIEGDEPLTDALGQDALAKQIGDSFFEATLENAWRNSKRLRATRDTAAIAASNANFKLYMEKIGGHL